MSPRVCPTNNWPSRSRAGQRPKTTGVAPPERRAALTSLEAPLAGVKTHNVPESRPRFGNRRATLAV